MLKENWKLWFVFAITIVGGNLLVGGLVTEEPVSHKFRGQYRRAMARKEPQLVLLGNSMLRASTDPAAVSRITGKSVLKLAHGGSASAGWYLMLKNTILNAKKKPEYVVLFFRDYFLTYPRYRVRGRYRDPLDDLSDGPEPLLAKLAFKKDFLTSYTEWLFPLFRHRKQLKKHVSTLVKTVSGELGGSGVKKTPDEQASEALNYVFSDDKMDDEIATKQQLDAESVDGNSRTFSEVVDSSFLPHIIEMTKEHGVRLILVRVKRRSVAENKPESDELLAYIKALKSYLDANEIPLIDFTYESQITVDQFGQGDHLGRERGKPVFSRLLGEKLLPYLK